MPCVSLCLSEMDSLRILLYSLIFLLSVFGNLLIIVVLMLNKRMRTVTNSFLLSLAVSDLMMAIFCMPFTLIPNMLEDFIFGATMCKIVTYLMGEHETFDTKPELNCTLLVYEAFKEIHFLCCFSKKGSSDLCVCRDYFRVFILQYNMLWATVFIDWCYITELQSWLIIRAQHIKSHDWQWGGLL